MTEGAEPTQAAEPQAPAASSEQQAPTVSDGQQAPAGDLYGIWMQTEAIRGSGGKPESHQVVTGSNPTPVETRPNPSRAETRQGSSGES